MLVLISVQLQSCCQKYSICSHSSFMSGTVMLNLVATGVSEFMLEAHSRNRCVNDSSLGFAMVFSLQKVQSPEISWLFSSLAKCFNCEFNLSL